MDKELFLRFLKHNRPIVLVILIVSIMLNLLVFSGSIYMLVVYDSVLPSGSVQTLIALFGVLVVIYLFQALFEAIRNEASLLLAGRLYRDVADRVHHATLTRPLRSGPLSGDGLQIVRDLDQVHSYLGSNGPIALIDLPWVIVFLLFLSILHWWLGLAALAGAIALAVIAWVSSRKTRDNSQNLAQTTGQRQAYIHAGLSSVEPAVAMGMRERLLSRSRQLDDVYLKQQSQLSLIVARFGSAGRVFRMFVQSLILTVGALLVIDGQASGGIILAASVLSGRALAPIDQAISNWRGLVAARAGWSRIVAAMMELPPPEAPEVELPKPTGEIVLSDVWIMPPGSSKPVVSAAGFTIHPGEAVAIIGPSAAGKTSLAKGLLGIWPLARGEIRLDGATHDQWNPEILGSAFGYVPQNVELFAGTIADNIARFDPQSTSETVIEAARDAGLHDTILAFPDGYGTQLSNGGQELSAGQRQRIGLARALYGKPHLVVLDEANSNLDQEGDEALATAIKAVRDRKGIVVMITHRPATLGPISHVAVLHAGRLADYGERDEVLKRTVKKPVQLTETA